MTNPLQKAIQSKHALLRHGSSDLKCLSKGIVSRSSLLNIRFYSNEHSETNLSSQWTRTEILVKTQAAHNKNQAKLHEKSHVASQNTSQDTSHATSQDTSQDTSQEISRDSPHAIPFETPNTFPQEIPHTKPQVLSHTISRTSNSLHQTNNETDEFEGRLQNRKLSESLREIEAKLDAESHESEKSKLEELQWNSNEQSELDRSKTNSKMKLGHLQNDSLKEETKAPLVEMFPELLIGKSLRESIKNLLEISPTISRQNMLNLYLRFGRRPKEAHPSTTNSFEVHPFETNLFEADSHKKQQIETFSSFRKRVSRVKQSILINIISRNVPNTPLQGSHEDNCQESRLQITEEIRQGIREEIRCFEDLKDHNLMDTSKALQERTISHKDITIPNRTPEHKAIVDKNLYEPLQRSLKSKFGISKALFNSILYQYGYHEKASREMKKISRKAKESIQNLVSQCIEHESKVLRIHKQVSDSEIDKLDISNANQPPRDIPKDQGNLIFTSPADSLNYGRNLLKSESDIPNYLNHQNHQNHHFSEESATLSSQAIPRVIYPPISQIVSFVKTQIQNNSSLYRHQGLDSISYQTLYRLVQQEVQRYIRGQIGKEHIQEVHLLAQNLMSKGVVRTVDICDKIQEETLLPRSVVYYLTRKFVENHILQMNQNSRMNQESIQNSQDTQGNQDSQSNRKEVSHREVQELITNYIIHNPHSSIRAITDIMSKFYKFPFSKRKLNLIVRNEITKFERRKIEKHWNIRVREYCESLESLPSDVEICDRLQSSIPIPRNFLYRIVRSTTQRLKNQENQQMRSESNSKECSINWSQNWESDKLDKPSKWDNSEKVNKMDREDKWSKMDREDRVTKSNKVDNWNETPEAASNVNVHHINFSFSPSMLKFIHEQSLHGKSITEIRDSLIVVYGEELKKWIVSKQSEENDDETNETNDFDDSNHSKGSNDLNSSYISSFQAHLYYKIGLEVAKVNRMKVTSAHRYIVRNAIQKTLEKALQERRFHESQERTEAISHLAPNRSKALEHTTIHDTTCVKFLENSPHDGQESLQLKFVDGYINIVELSKELELILPLHRAQIQRLIHEEIQKMDKMRVSNEERAIIRNFVRASIQRANRVKDSQPSSQSSSQSRSLSNSQYNYQSNSQFTSLVVNICDMLHSQLKIPRSVLYHLVKNELDRWDIKRISKEERLKAQAIIQERIISFMKSQSLINPLHEKEESPHSITFTREISQVLHPNAPHSLPNTRSLCDEIQPLFPNLSRRHLYIMIRNELRKLKTPNEVTK